MLNNKELGKYFREVRKERNLTIEQASTLINITPKALANIELGKSVPKIDTAMSICDVYATPWEEVYKFFRRSNETNYMMDLMHFPKH